MKTGQPAFRLEDLEPASGRLLVLPLAVASRTTTGIHLAETSHQRERPQHGIVIASGQALLTPTGAPRPRQFEVDDCVFFGKYSGQEFEFDGRRILNMAEIEVFGRLPKGRFTVVQHDLVKDWHLAGDYCDLCAAPEERAATARLQTARAERLDKKDIFGQMNGALPSGDTPK